MTKKASASGIVADQPRPHICRRPAFDRLYEQAKRLPDGPERNAIYREMCRLFAVYMPWRLGVHRYYNDIAQPWLLGYRRHPVMRGFWKYVDIDTAKLARAAGQ